MGSFFDFYTEDHKGNEAIAVLLGMRSSELCVFANFAFDLTRFGSELTISFRLGYDCVSMVVWI